MTLSKKNHTQKPANLSTTSQAGSMNPIGRDPIATTLKLLNLPATEENRNVLMCGTPNAPDEMQEMDSEENDSRLGALRVAQFKHQNAEFVRLSKLASKKHD